jgi:acyl-coenzyme A thioesterase PaaI-like protein
MQPGKEISLWKMKWMLFLLGVFKIPVVGFVRPKLLSINEDQVRVRIKLRRRTKNHLNSMYFGALAVGADVAGGIHAFYFAELAGTKVSFAFKGMKADFIKRAESDIIFQSDEGSLVRSAIESSKLSGERVNQPIQVYAKDLNDEVVATFEMIVSVKCY